MLHLSSARRDLGGATTASGTVVFGGGCVGGESVFTCEEASAAIDLFKDGQACDSTTATTAGGGGGGGGGISTSSADRSTGSIRSTAAPSLTYARGWPSTCALGESVAFLGGGTSGSRSHKPVLDVFDLTTMTVQGNSTALDAGQCQLCPTSAPLRV